jgi:hypothetical protein
MTGTLARTPRQNSLLAFSPVIFVSGNGGKLGMLQLLVTPIVLMRR